MHIFAKLIVILSTFEDGVLSIPVTKRVYNPKRLVAKFHNKCRVIASAPLCSSIENTKEPPKLYKAKTGIHSRSFL